MVSEQTTKARVNRHVAGAAIDRRGSAIVLVIVSCVLMAVIAATLLQVARFERIPRPTSNIDVIVELTIAEVLDQATDDILDNRGNAFNIRRTTTNGGGDEPWDYPWTNTTGGAGYYGRTAEDIDGNTINVVGGSMDDTWLAATAPDFRTTFPSYAIAADKSVTHGTHGAWRKISSITGLFLGGDTSGNADLTLKDKPDQFPVDFASPTRRDMNILANSPMLVDADGDGIGDSRWEWAPLRQIGATQYVIACRVIDLSSKADLNVAMGRFDVTNGTSNSRGDSPVELDANNLVFETSTGLASAASAVGEWRDVLNFRLTGTVNNGSSTPISTSTSYEGGTNPAAANSRQDYWTDGASRVSNAFDRNGTGSFGSNATFGIDDATELLYRNGLNNATTTTVETLMPAFFRGTSTAEANFAGGATSVTTDSFSKQTFWTDEPRKQFSPFTGSTIAAAPYAVDGNFNMRIDVNEAVKTPAGRTALRDRIKAILDSGNTAGITGWFSHLATTGDIASQLVANITDFIDEDNQLTQVGSRAGFEALPYITEVYTQKIYNAGAPTPSSSGIGEDVPWREPANTPQGYVIEIGNPFARRVGTSWTGRPVSLQNIWIQMYTGDTLEELTSLAGVPNELQPGEVLLLYQNTSGNTNDASLNNMATHHTRSNNNTGNFTTIHTAAGPGLPSNRTSSQIALFAEFDGGSTDSNKPYCRFDIQTSGSRFTETGVAAGTILQNDQGYVTTHYQGFGQGLQMMTVGHNSTVANGYYENVASLNKASVNSAMRAATLNLTSNLADQDKDNSPSIFTNLSGQQIVWPENPRDQMRWIGDLLNIPLLGHNTSRTGTNTLTATEFRSAAGGGTSLARGIEKLMLPYKTRTASAAAAEIAPVINNAQTTVPDSGRYGVFNIPHALLVLENLTTFNPATDGRDGDGDGNGGSRTSPDYDEMLVPGKINLNTVPEELLEDLIPTSNTTLKDQIAAAVALRRENLVQATQYGQGANGVPAIQHTASILENIEILTGNPSRLSGDTDTLSGARIDFNDYEAPLNTYPANTDGSNGDGVDDDREEELMVAKWLLEMTSNRSDVFAAYIVVQGYNANQFTAGAVESAKVIVLFSRANVRGSGDVAVEIGRLRIE